MQIREMYIVKERYRYANHYGLGKLRRGFGSDKYALFTFYCAVSLLK